MFVLRNSTPSQFRCSIVVSISACHAEDPGSIPGGGDFDVSGRQSKPVQNMFEEER